MCKVPGHGLSMGNPRDKGFVGPDGYPSRMTAPTAFLSHATEDKDRFAVPLAKRLRAQGVDVWVDQWEIKAGDSLVKKVFTNGIDNASVFIVVLSHTSIAKPWVSEELDSAVIRKIEGSCKIIPVLLDDLDRQEVPQPLRHLLWISASKLGLDGAVAEILRSVFDLETKPPIGSPPRYLSTVHRDASLTPDPVDNIVLNLLIDQNLATTGPVNSETISLRSSELDLTAEAVNESVAVLADRGVIRIHRIQGGAWILDRIPDHTLLEAWEKRGTDVKGLERRLLACIVNNPYQDVGDFEGAAPELVAAILRSFQARGLVHGNQVMGGKFIILSVSPAAARLVR